MKRTIFIVFFILLSLFSGIALATGTCDRSEDAVLYLPFESGSSRSTPDASNNNNNATVSGATLSSTAGHDSTGAYRFDGVDDYISAPLTDSWSTHGATLIAWIKPTSVTASHQVLNSESGGFGIENRATDIWYYHPKTSGSVATLYSTASADTSDWQYLALVLDSAASEVRIYKNEDKEEYSLSDLGLSSSSDLDVNGVTLTIGKSPAYGQYFTGYIDEVFAYDSALSDAEIESIYSGQFQCDDGEICTEDGSCEATEVLPSFDYVEWNGVTDYSTGTASIGFENAGAEGIIYYDCDILLEHQSGNTYLTDDTGSVTLDRGEYEEIPCTFDLTPTRLRLLGAQKAHEFEGNLDLTGTFRVRLITEEHYEVEKSIDFSLSEDEYVQCSNNADCHLRYTCDTSTGLCRKAITLSKTPKILTGKAIAVSAGNDGDLSLLMIVVGILGIVGITAVLKQKSKF